MASGVSWGDRAGAMRRMFSEVPGASSHEPNTAALKKARELGDADVVAAIERFQSMPQSTMILANPPLHDVIVDCAGSEVTLRVRSFGIRGILSESEIVSGKASPFDVIFIGLFGRRPQGDETQVLAELLDRRFRRAVGLDRSAPGGSLVERVAGFVVENPGLGPELTMQHCATMRKASYSGKVTAERGINDDRRAGQLLLQFFRTHMENVAAGGLSIYANRVRREHPGIDAKALSDRVRDFVQTEAAAGKHAFHIAYSLLLGRSANPTESRILEGMGVIQTHHGSAGSNVVARYIATLHVPSVSDFFTGAQIVMDGERHFGAIHDMTHFIEKLEAMPAGERDEAIRAHLLEGGLPTFGHPEIAAAGRGATIQQDPRAAIYTSPLFDAIDAGEITLSARQRERLGLIQRIYQIAFVRGVVKPGQEDRPPLRLTPNTDFGAWAVQEALGIYGASRTYLTYIFRGFGWMMDAREQMQQKIIRPVIAPDPSVIPTDRTDPTIPDVVMKMHRRLAGDAEAFARA